MTSTPRRQLIIADPSRRLVKSAPSAAIIQDDSRLAILGWWTESTASSVLVLSYEPHLHNHFSKGHSSNGQYNIPETGNSNNSPQPASRSSLQ